jgi:hypothetical protein
MLSVRRRRAVLGNTHNNERNEMNSSVRRWLRLVSAVVMVGLLSSCSPQSNPALVGKWQEKGDPSITEFRADGTFSIHLGEALTGKYQSVDSEHIKLTFDGVAGKVVGVSTWKAVVQGDTLDLTDPDGNKSQFQRQK